MTVRMRVPWTGHAAILPVRALPTRPGPTVDADAQVRTAVSRVRPSALRSPSCVIRHRVSRPTRDLLLDWSLGVRPGWQVLVATTAEARPLAEALSRGLARRGAYALTRIHFGGLYPLDAAWTGEAAERSQSRSPPLEQEVVDRVDGIVLVLAPERPARRRRRPARAPGRRCAPS